MFLGLDWYWWVLIVLGVVSIPFKIKFVKWWNLRQKQNDDGKKGKWGDEE